MPVEALATDHVSANLRRVMAREGLTLETIVELSGVDERTVRGILAGRNKPHARTLHKLAEGLGIPSDEFFQDPSLLAYRAFDRATNPQVDEVIEAHQSLFAGWSQADFAELYSRMGAGGALTQAGALATAEAMNARRELLEKVALILETHEADLLREMIDVLYKRVVVE
jgi:transcriptional regulator with XRE-family HTH domain